MSGGRYAQGIHKIRIVNEVKKNYTKWTFLKDLPNLILAEEVAINTLAKLVSTVVCGSHRIIGSRC